jgi:hypothetical protein
MNRTKNRHKRSMGDKVTIHVDRATADAIIQLAEMIQGRLPEASCVVEDAPDPIPENAIGLLNAFYKVLDLALQNPSKLTLEEDEREEIRTTTDSEFRQFVGEDYSKWYDLNSIVVGKETNIFLRKCVADGQLSPRVRDPETGEILRVSHEGWDNVEFPPGELGWPRSNHVHPDDPYDPGPADVIVRGKARPVFFPQAEFEVWLKQTFGTGKRRGRRPGSGSWHIADEPLLLEMKKLIDPRTFRSPEAAAYEVAARAAGGGTRQSKATRLAKQYRERFPSERN